MLAAPFLILGLGVAGFLHVLLPSSLIQRWMGRPGLSGVTLAALIGVPLPVCSCGVVPISVELKRKGASAPSSLSFLTTTPESSIDSIFFTYALMGPILAIARPIAAFFTAFIGGVMAIAYLPEDDDAVAKPGSLKEDSAAESSAAEDIDCGCHHDHGHDHGDGDHEHSHGIGYAQSPEALAALRSLWPRGWRRSASDDTAVPHRGLWRSVIRPALRYGFGELLDDLAFWLIFGVVLAGTLGALLPSDLGDRGLGSGLLPMLMMLAVGIPIYMCASASTPIAAALMAKGISPGAALVFLLAGPATNAATLVLLGRTFSRRFIEIYLASVVLGALIAGLALDALAGYFGWQVLAPLVEGESALGGGIEAFFAVLLSLLLIRSLWRGAWKQGMAELRQGFAGAVDVAAWRRHRRALTVVGLVLLLAIYLASGLFIVPTDSQGYALRFEALHTADLPPGLHWAPPAPFGRPEVWRTDYARKADIGFRTDLGLLAQRKELARFANPDEWHSTVAAMNTNPEQATFLTADENLVEMSFTIHYGLSDPSAFFYRVDHTHNIVSLYAEAAARRFLAGNILEELLTTRRREIEMAIADSLQRRLDALGVGIVVHTLRVVDIHPPSGAVFAFRDVSSASEDKQTRIHRAKEVKARDVPRTRGEAALLVARSKADAASRITRSEGRSLAFMSQAEALGAERDLLMHLLWIETSEEVLAGREKIIVPPGSGGTGVTLWRRPPR